MPKKNCLLFFFSDDFGLRSPVIEKNKIAKKRYTSISQQFEFAREHGFARKEVYLNMAYLRRFWVTEPRHSETVIARKRYTLIWRIYDDFGLRSGSPSFRKTKYPKKRYTSIVARVTDFKTNEIPRLPTVLLSIIGVIRFSLGKLLVNLLQQVVKRTNTPLIPQKMASSTEPCFCCGRGFESRHPPHIINFFRLSPCMSNLKNTLPGTPRK